MEQNSVGNHAAQQFNTLLRKDLNSQASFKSCLRDSETDKTLQANKRSMAELIRLRCSSLARVEQGF